MSALNDTDALIGSCITAAEHVNRSGSPALQQAMRVVLFILGRELAQREARRCQPGGRASSGEPFALIIGKRPS